MVFEESVVYLKQSSQQSNDLVNKSYVFTGIEN